MHVAGAKHLRIVAVRGIGGVVVVPVADVLDDGALADDLEVDPAARRTADEIGVSAPPAVGVHVAPHCHQIVADVVGGIRSVPAPPSGSFGSYHGRESPSAAIVHVLEAAGPESETARIVLDLVGDHELIGRPAVAVMAEVIGDSEQVFAAGIKRLVNHVPDVPRRAGRKVQRADLHAELVGALGEGLLETQRLLPVPVPVGLVQALPAVNPRELLLVEIELVCQAGAVVGRVGEVHPDVVVHSGAPDEDGVRQMVKSIEEIDRTVRAVASVLRVPAVQQDGLGVQVGQFLLAEAVVLAPADLADADGLGPCAAAECPPLVPTGRDAAAEGLLEARIADKIRPDRGGDQCFGIHRIGFGSRWRIGRDRPGERDMVEPDLRAVAVLRPLASAFQRNGDDRMNGLDGYRGGDPGVLRADFVPDHSAAVAVRLPVTIHPEPRQQILAVVALRGEVQIDLHRGRVCLAGHDVDLLIDAGLLVVFRGLRQLEFLRETAVIESVAADEVNLCDVGVVLPGNPLVGSAVGEAALEVGIVHFSPAGPGRRIRREHRTRVLGANERARRHANEENT